MEEDVCREGEEVIPKQSESEGWTGLVGHTLAISRVQAFKIAVEKIYTIFFNKFLLNFTL